MGYLTLRRFRDELNLSLGGNRQGSNERLDSWINLGYFEAANVTEYEGLKMSATASTVAGQASYSLPDDLMTIISVADLSNKRRIVNLGLRNYHLKDREVEGPPRFYSRRKRVVYLWPTPDAVYDWEMYYLEEICPLEEVDDVTVLPQSFDALVLSLARKHAFQAIGDEQKAIYHSQIASRERTKLPSDTEEADQVNMGVTVAYSFDDLTEMETEVPD